MSAPDNTIGTRFQKPKILLIDCDPEIHEMLSNLGLNIRVGSFGNPYEAEPAPSQAFPVYGEFSFPNAAEQEILVIDLLAPNLGDQPAGQTTDPDINLSWRSWANNGLIDPRPAGAELASPEFDVVFGRGAIFVVFADFYKPTEFLIPERGSQPQSRRGSVSYMSSVWNFLTCLRQLVVQSREGNEMIADATSDLGRFVSPFLQGSHYNCFFPSLRDWIPCSVIATNKHGDAVAIANLGESNRIIILPQLGEKSEFIRKLIVDFLPHRFPEFFPEFGSKGWVKEPEYELPKILELNIRIEAEREEYERRIKVIDDQIRVERETNGWMLDLLTETGDGLVEAVKQAVAALGFSKVKDVDADLDAQGKNRREDLQVLDQAPTIIVDVKGLGGVPSDPDMQQPSKHALMRMRDWKRTDVVSLFIVNQERHIPPLQRTAEPFRPEMVGNCEEEGTGLLTTWDLYRLVRGMWKHGWPTESLKPLFYKSGRILPIPTHYHLLGAATEVFTRAFVLIAKADLKKGDRLAWEEGTAFREQTVVSLEVADQPVESVSADTEVGIQTEPSHGKLKKGRTIYVIRT